MKGLPQNIVERPADVKFSLARSLRVLSYPGAEKKVDKERGIPVECWVAVL